MLYTINRIEDFENGDTIVETLRRSGDQNAKSQAFAEARKMAARNPGSTVLVEEVVSQSITDVIAIAGAHVDKALEVWDKAEDLNKSALKLKTLNSALKRTAERVANDLGMTETMARKKILEELSKLD